MEANEVATDGNNWQFVLPVDIQGMVLKEDDLQLAGKCT